MVRRWTTILTTALFLLATAACGDDDAGEATTTAPAVTTAITTTTAAEPVSPECPAGPFTGTVYSEGDGSDHAAFSLTDGDVVLAAAFALTSGVQYTVYLADYDLGGQEIGVGTVEADPGQVVITLQARNPDGTDIEVGMSYEETFVIMDSGGGAMGSPVDPKGTVTFSGVGDGRICFEIDYTDEGQVLQGMVSAEVVGGFGF